MVKPVIGSTGWGTVLNSHLDTLAAKDSQIVNVMDHGASGNGSTDDTAAINAVIAAAPTGSTVLVPAGSTFMINADYNGGFSILPKSGVNLRIDGTLQTITNALAAFAVIRSRGISDYSITGSGSIVGDRSTHTGSTNDVGVGIRIDGGARINVSGVTLVDHWGDGLYLNVNTTAGTEVTDVRISDVQINNARRNGCSVVGAIGVSFIGCNFYNTNGVSPQTGLDLEPNGANVVRAVTVTGCVFRNNVVQGIQVSSGASDVVISSNVFDGAHTDSAMRIAGSDVAVTGNTVRGGLLGVHASLCPRLTITNNRIYGTSSIAIDVESGCPEVIVSGNAVGDAGAEGIKIRGSLGFVCTDNIISRVGTTALYGINISYASTSAGGNGIIADNVLTDCQGGGIIVANPNVHVHDNLIIGASLATTNTYYGIYVAQGATTTDCRVIGNVFRVGSTGAQVKYGVFVLTAVLRTTVLSNDYYGATGTLDLRDDGTGTVSTITVSAVPDGLKRAWDSLFVAWPGDPAVYYSTSQTALVSQTLYVTRVKVDHAGIITYGTFTLGTSGTVITAAGMELFNSAGTSIASADISATLAATTGDKKVAFTAATGVRTPGEVLYIGIWANFSGTAAALRGIATTNKPNIGVSAANSWYGTAGTTITAAPGSITPSAITAAATGAQCHWIGLS